MDQELLVNVVIESLDLAVGLFDMDKSTLDRRTITSDGVSCQFAVHADSPHVAVDALAVAKKPVYALFFVIYTIIFVINSSLIQPFFMKIFYFFDVTAAEGFVGKLTFVLPLKGIYKIFFL